MIGSLEDVLGNTSDLVHCWYRHEAGCARQEPVPRVPQSKKLGNTKVDSVLTSAALKISEILAGPFLLNVPAYQRHYSWGEVQVQQLLDDLLEASGIAEERRPEECYFLGAILLMDSPNVRTTRLSPKMAAREFDVVDGQQRLATLLTLFCVLRDLEPSGRGAIARMVHAFVTAQKGRGLFRADAERVRLLLGESDRPVFEELILAEGSTLREPETLFFTPSARALLKMRDVIVATLQDLTELQRAALFDFVTERCNVVVIVSKDIDHAHRMFVVLNERGKRLQRDDIIKADVLSRASAGDATWIAEIWDRTSAELGKEFEKFFSHVRKIYGQESPKVVSGVRSVIADAGGPEPFIKNIFLPLSKSYRTILNGNASDLPEEIRHRLTYLNRLPDGDWAPAAMLALKDWEQDPDRAKLLIAEIDRMVHVIRLSCAGTGKRLRRFSPIIAALRSGEPIDAQHPVFQITRDESRAINFHMKDLHKRGPKICKLLLMRLGDTMDGKLHDLDPELYTIEHILPQRPALTSEWRRIFPTAEDRSQCVESIGNLVLVTQKQNDKARNASFAEKKQIYADAPEHAPVLPITRDVLSVDRWTRIEIEQREARLLAMIASLLRIDVAPSIPGPPKTSVPPEDTKQKRASGA